MENNPDRFSVIARSRKQVARPHASCARCDPPISARRSPSSRHLAPINAQQNNDISKNIRLSRLRTSHLTVLFHGLFLILTVLFHGLFLTVLLSHFFQFGRAVKSPPSPP
ncbi:hypothetical protein EVAR_84244_1 [Eumeta japonica]|uniref:Uncharacterized protein n=1 Tax=Eumeta variegata TaxID=151549 RepID=A0A4C1WR70_EUMVA|nr:hypothetical protein EVAR_84244_1 [Eumeta japonica]